MRRNTKKIGLTGMVDIMAEAGLVTAALDENWPLRKTVALVISDNGV